MQPGAVAGFANSPGQRGCPACQVFFCCWAPPLFRPCCHLRLGARFRVATCCELGLELSERITPLPPPYLCDCVNGRLRTGKQGVRSDTASFLPSFLPSYSPPGGVGVCCKPAGAEREAGLGWGDRCVSVGLLSHTQRPLPAPPPPHSLLAALSHPFCSCCLTDRPGRR